MATRDLDVGEFNGLDGRRVEVIADGLPLWHGAQLAIDTTLVSLVTIARRRHGQAPRGQQQRSSSAGQRGNLPRTLWRGRARLVGGPWGGGGRTSQEVPIFLRDLAKARAQVAPLILQALV